MRARTVSHSNIKTPRWQNVNVQRRKLWVPELERHVTLKLTTSDLRTIDKSGLVAFAKKHGYKLDLTTLDYGGERYLKTGVVLTDEEMLAMKKFDAILLGD